MSASPRDWFSLNARGAMEIILACLVLEYYPINDKVFVALVITTIATSILGGPRIQWAMRKTAALRYGMIPIDR